MVDGFVAIFKSFLKGMFSSSFTHIEPDWCIILIGIWRWITSRVIGGLVLQVT